MRRPAVYIMANKPHGTLYTGVTSNLSRRVFEHKNGTASAFTRRYGCTVLVYVERYDDMPSAIFREKQLKGGSRRDKLVLINAANPDWRDLSGEIGE